MGKIGKISVIPKDYGSAAMPTMEKSLRERGHSRAPGTVLMRFPYREASGKYRTGLDEDAKYIKEMPEGDLKEAEKARVIALRKKLEEATGLDLNPRSSYYNHLSKDTYKVSPIKLRDEDNIFNLEDPWQEITWCWIKSHPSIAHSLTAYNKGLYPADTQFYVNDEDVESEVLFKKKKVINDAIIRFDGFSIDKRRKIARLLDLPVTDSTKEEVVYNLVDDFLKKSTVIGGVHKGREPVKVFAAYAGLPDAVLNIRNIVNVAFKEQVYREKEGGRVYEGELEVFKNKDELINFLLDDRNQRDLLELESKINARKLQHVV
jgi:hypothetical protein